MVETAQKSVGYSTANVGFEGIMELFIDYITDGKVKLYKKQKPDLLSHILLLILGVVVLKGLPQNTEKTI